MNFSDLSLNNILLNYVPLIFGIIGIFVLLVGILKLVTGKDEAFNQILSGIFTIGLAIGLKFLMTWLLPILSI
jgi:hypothetical protein